MAELSVVGKSVPRVDTVGKVTGNARYCMDLRPSKALYGIIKRSLLPHARLVNIDTRKAEKLAGVKAVVTADDTPNVRFGKFLKDELLLAHRKVLFIGEPIAAVAAVDREIAEEAAGLIEVEYEELPALFDPVAAMREDSVIIHEDLKNYRANFKYIRYGNICSHNTIIKGDIEAGFRKADFVCEDTFETPMVHQSYLETWSATAEADTSGNIDIWASTNEPFRVRGEISAALEIPVARIRLHSINVGGSFGGKMAAIPGICALLARKAGRPVKLELTREEDFQGATPRHPAVITIKTGAMKDGTLVARKVKLVFDTGAYAQLGPIVLGLASAFAPGPYNIPNVYVDGYCVYTNKEPCGAFRGFGNPQEKFASESQLDIIAHNLGISPVDIRRKNLLKNGGELPTGQQLYDIGLEETLEKASSAISPGRTLQSGNGGRKRGTGIACMMRSCGILASGAFVNLNDDGSFTLLTGAQEVGQGSDTVLLQIAAEELGIEFKDISIISADTATTPFDFGSIASSNTHTSGSAVKLAAADLKNKLLELAAERLSVDTKDLRISNRRVIVKGNPEKNLSIQELAMITLFQKGGPMSGQGSFLEKRQPIDAGRVQGFPFMHGFPALMHATQIAEVEVDIETGQVSILRVIAAHDVGRVMHPVNIEGQIHGGVVQGIGYALTEEILFENGRVLNPNFTDYKIPTALDVPEIIPIFVEEPDSNGPFGAKGVGEGPLTPVAAAIANAIYDAVGVRIKELPITPGKILKALREKKS